MRKNGGRDKWLWLDRLVSRHIDQGWMD